MRAHRAALDNSVFDRAYLFHGDDDYLKDESARALIERATEPATREFNLDVLRGGELDAAAAALALDALPLMAARRVVVVRDVAALKKDARAMILRYLERPAEDVILLLVAASGTKPDAGFFERASTVEFKPLTEEHLTAWVNHRVGTLGSSITPEAAELLCGATGSDLALLAGEIEKLRSFTNGEVIDEAAIDAVVGVRRGETLGDLLDLVGERNGGRAAALLGRVLAQPKTTGVSILMALTTQTLAIGWALAARARGLPAQHLEREFYGLLKENPSSLVGRPWGEAVSPWARALRRWDGEMVDRALTLLLLADASIKDTRISTEEQVLTSLLLGMTAGAPRRVAA